MEYFLREENIEDVIVVASYQKAEEAYSYFRGSNMVKKMYIYCSRIDEREAPSWEYKQPMKLLALI